MTADITPLDNAQWLPHAAIRPNPNQPRRYFSEAALVGLRESIRTHGMRQPMEVRHEPSGYDGTPFVIVAGERRWRASEGVLARVPCLITNATPVQARELALVENIQRENLTALEEAHAVAELMREHELSARAVARRLGMSDGWVNNRLALLKTAPDVQEVAARVPLALSSLVLIDKVRDDPEARRGLLEQVTAGASHAQIKTAIATHQEEARRRRESNHAPDRQTQARSVAHERHGGGQMSRGHQVTGLGRAEARVELKSALGRAEAGLMAARGWVAVADDERELATMLSRLRRALEALEEAARDGVKNRA